MQKLVDWLLGRRVAVVLVAVVFAPNITIVSSAVMGLQWVWRGPAVAVGDALLACLAITIIAIGAAGGLTGAMPIAVAGCSSIVIGCFVGGILRRTGGLTLSVQIILLIAFAGIALYTLFGSTSNDLFDAQMAQFIEVLRLQNRPAVEVAAISELQPRLVGFFGLEICLRIVLALFLVSWALGIARRRPEFGQQFRALRIGYVLGIPSALVVVLALLWNSTLLHNLFGIAALAFMLQGLALLHARGHAASWHPLQYVPIYFIGVLFGSYLLLIGIFSEGLLD
ncbi:MAG: hypothetical protein PVF50_09050 [Gammaproteobacteria bacterium]|jgi:hypothetical protein